MWLELQYLQATSADPGHHRSLEQSAFRLKRLESAQRRFQGAVQSLTTLRTLLPAGEPAAALPKVCEERQRKRA
jgi:hypothetical protein